MNSRTFGSPPHDRPTWNSTAMRHAVFPDRGYFGLSPVGTVTAEANDATWFRPAGDGRSVSVAANVLARVRDGR